MFLFERLFGVATYIYLLVIACLLIGFTNVKSKNIFRLYTVALCVMGFFYTPSETGDLYRTFNTMEWYAGMEFSYFFENLVATSSVPVSRILYWLVGTTGIYNLLPVISSLVSYSLIFYTMEKTQTIYSISRKNVAIALFLLMTTSIYISVVGGVRMTIAMSLIVFCFFRESVEHKFRWYDILLYIIAVFMHDMAIIILAVRLLSPILDSRRKILTRVVLAVIVVFLGVVFVFAFDSLWSQIFDKIVEYLFEPGYYDVWEYIIGAVLFLTYFVVAVKFRPYNRNTLYSDIKVYNICMVLSAVIALVFCFEFSIFYRFIGHLVPLLGLPMTMVTLQESQNSAETEKNKQVSFQSVILFFGIIILILSCARGSLSSLKFFTLS